MPRTAVRSAPVAGAQSDEIVVDIPFGARRPKTIEITRSLIHPDPEQPREHADAELRAAIAVEGLIEPIIVRPHPTLPAEWMIVNGERRWRGCEGVLKDLPCIVRSDLEDPVRRLAVQLIANYGKPTPPLDEAKAFLRMVTMGDLTAADVAKLVGRPVSTVAERLALMELGPWLPLLESGAVVMSHAVKVLLPLRGATPDVHQAVILELRQGRVFDGSEQLTVDDFREKVLRAIRPHLYPLKKSTAHGVKSPEFNTAKHDDECECGRISVKEGYPPKDRPYCGNPAWWKPQHTAAVKAAKQREKKESEKSTPASALPGRPLQLPAGVSVLKPTYGRPAKGVVQLTDSGGTWLIQRGNAFDPADLTIDEAKLVVWTTPYMTDRDFALVGIRDESAVAGARELWNARLESERVQALDAFRAEISGARDRYGVSGPGAVALLQVIAGMESQRGEETLTDLLDVAEALALPIDRESVDSGWGAADRAVGQIGMLSDAEAAQLLSGFTMLADGQLPSVDERVATIEMNWIREIRERVTPWVGKPGKGAKSARKGRQAAAALTVDGKALSDETIELPLVTAARELIDEDDEEDGGWAPSTDDGEDDGDDLWNAPVEDDDDEEAPLVGAAGD